MKLLFFLTCIVVYVVSLYGVDLHPLGYTLDSATYTRFTYSFAHIGFIHLFFNLLSIHFLSRSIVRKKVITYTVLYPISVVGSFLATYGTEMAEPTIGASGVGFFLYGAFLVCYPTFQNFMNALAVLAASIATFYFLSTNLFVHLIATIYGALAMLFLHVLHQINSTYTR